MSQKTSFALITGCSSGIGKELAIAFANSGITVLATARRTESLSKLTSKYDKIEAFALELSNLASIDKLKDAVSERTGGRLDFLVNNAGTHYASTAVDLQVEEAIKLFTVNLFAAMRLCQVFVPLLRRSGRGRIVQIGSVTRDIPVVWQGAYNASKAALSQYFKTLRLEVKPFNIEVIEIVTGFVLSNILHHGLYAPETSSYLPIKSTIERFKYEGNQNGMSPEAYANSVVTKLIRPQVSPGIWAGALAQSLRWLAMLLPLRLLNWIFYRRFELARVKAQLDDEAQQEDHTSSQA